MRIAFNCGAVHVCSRVAFIRIADNIFCITLSFKACFPLHTSGDSCTTASAETGILYFLNNLLPAMLLAAPLALGDNVRTMNS